jgi:membrane protein insertase Oxa1/YidC/SpoIIIJ
MGSGFAFDAIRNVQNNRALRKLHRAGYNELKEVVDKIKAKHPHKFVDRSQLSEKELKKLKKKIKINIVKGRQKSILLSLLFTAIVGTAIYFIVVFLYNYFFMS